MSLCKTTEHTQSYKKNKSFLEYQKDTHTHTHIPTQRATAAVQFVYITADFVLFVFYPVFTDDDGVFFSFFLSFDGSAHAAQIGFVCEALCAFDAS